MQVEREREREREKGFAMLTDPIGCRRNGLDVTK